jgi:hypothetical protein
MKRLGFFVSFLSVTLASAVAFADDSEDDEIAPLPPPTARVTATATTAASDAVHLRSGGLYRGRVTEIVPGDHVTVIVPPNGEVKRIAWPEVDRVIVASTPIPPPPTSAAPAPSAQAATEAPMVGPRARVHITSSKPVILYRRAAGSSAFIEACTSPCDRELPIGDTYRLAGSGLSQNKELRLSAGPGGFVDIEVDPPSVPGMLLGGALAALGWTVGYVGLLVALSGAAGNDDGARDGGLGALAIGGAASVGGVLIFLNSAKTDVVQTSRAARDAFVRTPSWRTSEVQGRTPAAAFPLQFTMRF